MYSLSPFLSRPPLKLNVQHQNSTTFGKKNLKFLGCLFVQGLVSVEELAVVLQLVEGPQYVLLDVSPGQFAL